MATFNYARLRATADRLIQQFGGAVTFKRIETSGTAWNPVGAEAQFTAFAAVVDYNVTEIDGSLVQAGDRRALVSAVDLDIEPKPGDHLERGSERWRVVRVSRIDVDGSGSVIWDLQLRH